MAVVSSKIASIITIYFIGRIICAIEGWIRVWAADAKSEKVSPSMKCKLLSVALRKSKYTIFVHAFHDQVSVKCNKEWTDVIELAGKKILIRFLLRGRLPQFPCTRDIIIKIWGQILFFYGDDRFPNARKTSWPSKFWSNSCSLLGR